MSKRRQVSLFFAAEFPCYRKSFPCYFRALHFVGTPYDCCITFSGIRLSGATFAPFPVFFPVFSGISDDETGSKATASATTKLLGFLRFCGPLCASTDEAAK